MLYNLKLGDVKSSKKVQIRVPEYFDVKEKDIENFFSTRLSELIDHTDLLLIGQERPFQREADLLALDEKGTLYIFELKRWKSTNEDMLQVLRYGQKFGRCDYEELNNYAKSVGKISRDISDLHQLHFGLDKPLEKSAFNANQVFVLLTSGTDSDTLSAAEYWKEKGLKIRCIPYRIYDVEGDPFIQFDTFDPDKEIAPEENTSYFIVNTNKTWDESAWKHMISDGSKGRASAFGDRSPAVQPISRGSTVYLYHTGTGVIAKGEAKSSPQGPTTYQGDGTENFVPLKFEWALVNEKDWNDQAIRPWEINGRLNSGHRFRQTAFSISQEMADAIDSIRSDKQQNKR